MPSRYIRMMRRLSKVYVLGNPLLEEDSLPLRLLPRLRKAFPDIEFLEIDPTEEFPEEDELVIIDTVLNTEKVVVIKDIDKLSSQPNYSLHDFDLSFQLKMMKKMGKLKEVEIIGLPPDLDEKEAIDQISTLLPS